MSATATALAQRQPASASAAARSLAEPHGFSGSRPLTPVESYLLTQTTFEGRRSQLTCLRRVARILGCPFDELRWEEMRADDLLLVKTMMLRDDYSPSTVNATLSAMKGVARACWRKGLITHDDYLHVADVRGARGDRVSPHLPITADELRLLLAACDDDPFEVCAARDSALIALLVGAGLRRGEVFRLERRHYDVGRRALVVRGKGNKERVIFFEDAGTHDRLARWLVVRGDEPGALLCPVDKEGRIRLKPMGSQTVYFAVRRRAAQAGLGHLAPHALRHTLGTGLITGGASVRDVQEILGHARVTTTELYDHRTEESQRQAMRLVSLPPPRRKRKPRSARHRRSRRRVNTPPKIPLTKEARERLAAERPDGASAD